jgi:prophage maintenance system killer protein
MKEIEIYKSKDGSTEVEVHFKEETVWLTQEQIAAIFGTQRPAITKHLKNIFNSKELKEKVVSSILEHTTSHGAIKGKTQTKKVKYYNLDAIISVGYRVNSRQATRFRQWATQRLKEYLIQGYAINQKRLDQLKKVVEVIQQSGKTETVHLAEAKGLLDILSNYAQSFILLNQYDSNDLQTENLNEHITYEIEYQEARAAIDILKKQLITKKEATALFGNEKDDTFKSSLRTVVQTFDGNFLYPSIEEQAAHLLYFVIKNHSFSDGNKRIGAFLFIWFLEKNRHRFKKTGELKINDNALVALALLIAQSHPDEKELMIKLIINLIKS